MPEDGGPLGGGVTLAGSAGLGALTEALLAGLLGLGAVLVQELEQLSGYTGRIFRSTEADN